MGTYDKQLRINNAAASGDLTVVGASTGLSTKVYGLRLSASAAVVVTLKRGSTVLEVFNFAAAGTLVLPLRQEPYYQTNANEAFIVSPGSAVQVDGMVEYTTS